MKLHFSIILLLAAESFGKICDQLCDGDPVEKASHVSAVLTTFLKGQKNELIASDDYNVGFSRILNGTLGDVVHSNSTFAGGYSYKAHFQLSTDQLVDLFIYNEVNVAFASIHGKPGDQVYIDRSFDGGRDWETRMGNIGILDGSDTAETALFNIDNGKTKKMGVVRACGEFTLPNNTAYLCTHWRRGTRHASFPAEAAATALVMYYNNNGTWDRIGWWQSAVVLTSLIEYMNVTGDKTYLHIVENTFEKTGNISIESLHDKGWWGLAWIAAYDLTGENKYLQAAKLAVAFMYQVRDDQCGGGIYHSITKDYKNAITNGIFIKLAAALHNRIPGDVMFLQWALEVWRWFDASGMIIKENLVNDGLESLGTHNQGVILGALVELNKASGDKRYLDKARAIADAMTHSNYFNKNGILHEPCEHNEDNCGPDAPNYKGIFASNLGELNAVLDDHPYSDYIVRNGDTIYKNKDSFDEYGLHYEGPFQHFSPSTQQSALSMLVAQERLTRAKGI